jgi:hypothetical protein
MGQQLKRKWKDRNNGWSRSTDRWQQAGRCTGQIVSLVSSTLQCFKKLLFFV